MEFEFEFNLEAVGRLAAPTARLKLPLFEKLKNF